MVQEVFKRYEKKYLLTEEQYRSLMLVLNGIMDLDEYGIHTICNIYLDTPDYELIRTSIEKPVYKEKVRLRCYGTDIDDSSPVFVELKRKYKSVVYKRRMQMNLESARKYLYYGINPGMEGQIYREVDYTVRHYGLRPMAYISYERMACLCRLDQELRVTFDRKILGRTGELDLRVKPYGKCLLPRETVLMEIKIAGAMPVWMGRLLSERKIYPTSYSKYGTFYESYIYPAIAKAVMDDRGYWNPDFRFKQGGPICA